MNAKNKIQFGHVEIAPQAFQSKNVKERITIFIDEDVVNRFRDQAKASGIGYQTLINQTLRSAVFPFEGSTDAPKNFIRASESEVGVNMEALKELVAAKDELIGLLGRKKTKKRA